MIAKAIKYFGNDVILTCDAQCQKAWGISCRPKIELSDNDDDYAFLSDDELGIAPIDPGTYEGGHAKPQDPEEWLNKWCAHECERSVMAQPSKGYTLPDFSKRVANVAPFYGLPVPDKSDV